MRQVATELGISNETLRSWIKQETSLPVKVAVTPWRCVTRVVGEDAESVSRTGVDGPTEVDRAALPRLFGDGTHAPASAAACPTSTARSRMGPTSATIWARLTFPMRGSEARSSALGCSSSNAPDAGHRSWHVDVLCRPVGWLGTYRRSRQSGVWFSGPHRYHQVGNQDHP